MNDKTRKAVAIGTFIGLFDGLTGVGGGAILVALMVSWLGLSQHVAQGTTPVIIFPVALSGAITYAIQGLNGKFLFDTSLAMSIIPAVAFPSMFGVIVGATWMSALPASQLKRAFGVFLFFVAFSMLTRGILPIGASPGETVAVPFIFWIMLGFVTGVFSGFLGIGGALVLVPFMTLGAGIPQHMSQGITLAIVTITSTVGAYTQYRLRHVSLESALAMAPSALVAVVGASLLAGHLEAFWLTKIFGLVMAYFGYQFAFSGPRKERQPVADPAVGFYNI